LPPFSIQASPVNRQSTSEGRTLRILNSRDVAELAGRAVWQLGAARSRVSAIWAFLGVQGRKKVCEPFASCIWQQRQELLPVRWRSVFWSMLAAFYWQMLA